VAELSSERPTAPPFGSPDQQWPRSESAEASLLLMSIVNVFRQNDHVANLRPWQHALASVNARSRQSWRLPCTRIESPTQNVAKIIHKCPKRRPDTRTNLGAVKLFTTAKFSGAWGMPLAAGGRSRPGNHAARECDPVFRPCWRDQISPSLLFGKTRPESSLRPARAAIP
jgi:hypothetical protein